VRHLLPLLAIPLAVVSCAPEKQLYVSDAWVRLPAAPGRPAAAYFTVHGGPTDSVLVNVTTDVAIKTEMHETKNAGGRMSMAPIRDVRVPALQSVAFAPGGRHVMVFDLDPSVKAGATITFTFTFGDATRILQTARVIAAGDPAPAK